MEKCGCFTDIEDNATQESDKSAISVLQILNRFYGIISDIWWDIDLF